MVGFCVQPVQSTETQQQQDKAAEVKVQRNQKQKKPLKDKSAADQKLENRCVQKLLHVFARVVSLLTSLHRPRSFVCWFRESSLQKADEDERGHETSVKKSRKRKASEVGGENDVEHWVMKRQRLKASKEVEAAKRRNTVFVGNLPISCTKKVSFSCC